jgi:hypothetical protein
MFDDIKKSISAILYETTTSPLFGTFIISWLVCNWKIVYLTFFISEDKIEITKIDYITTNCNNEWNLIWLPLISTSILITIIPIFSNGAYWLTIIYNKWKVEKKKEVELSQQLTLEQSIELRKQISEQENQFEKMLSNKDLEIRQLRQIIDTNKSQIGETEFEELAKRIKDNSTELNIYKDIIRRIQNNNYADDSDKKNADVIHLLESYNVIENKGNGTYKYTEQGKDFLKLMTK